MFDEFLDKAMELREKGEAFAVATVVRFEAPVSGKPGDRAIVRGNGALWGWIGGGCAQPAVIRESLRALQDGAPRLVRIHPQAGGDGGEGVVDYTMTCHSGGSLDIFIEPVVPKPHIVIFGRSAVAQTLARLGKAMHYKVSAIAPGANSEHFPNIDAIYETIDLGAVKMTPKTFAVVSTQGEFDEEALTEALRGGAPYVAFVASPKKAQKIFEALGARGVSQRELERVVSPAGVEIGAVSPEEIAVSILAQIVEKGRTLKAAVEAPREEVDPVCGMAVDPARAAYRSEYQGRTVYFCCPGCRREFDQDPTKFSAAF